MTTYDGRCHCGTVAYVLETNASVMDALRRCKCEFCTKAGPLWASDPAGKLAIRVQQAKSIRRYRFGSETADFLFCSRCGTLVGASCLIDGKDYAIINARTLCTDEDLVASSTHDFEKEYVDDRLERRRQNWIGNVIFEFTRG